MFPVVLVKVKLGIGRFANSYQACNTKLYFSIHTFNTLSVTVVNRVEGEDIQMVHTVSDSVDIPDPRCVEGPVSH